LCIHSSMEKAVAVFNTRSVKGTVVFSNKKNGLHITAEFTQLPTGKGTSLHGFHIHKAGDLRGLGCLNACEHYHKGPPCAHGGPPGSKGERHTGDLGNVSVGRYTYTLEDVSVQDVIGRSVIVHAGTDDYGQGDYEDSHTTGHSGARIGCAIIGRVAC